MRLDPNLALAFAIHSSPGTYALLIGSGLSRSAGIPTGWEITLDLIRRVALLQTEDAGPDPAAWYLKKFGTEPDYRNVIQAVARTAPERQALLRSYFEPTPEERRQGLKVPTVGHRAIASLIKDGFIRVVVTTNFDRLIEQALEADGIAPVVISSPDAVEGALPIVHARTTVLKLHGDYLDIRIRNTANELESYDPRITTLLNRIFDEFGLIVSGWSAEWDTALRDSLFRRQSRRFTTFWITRSDPKGRAADLTKHLGAEVIRIQNADAFFNGLRNHVASLQELDQPHPLTVRSAVATLKKLLGDPNLHRIAITDLIRNETNQTIERIKDKTLMDCQGTGDIKGEFLRRVKELEQRSELLVAIVGNATYWEGDRFANLCKELVERLANAPEIIGGYTVLLNVRRYPAMLALYTAGIAALANNQIKALASICWEARVREGNEQYQAAVGLGWSVTFDHQVGKNLPGMQDRKYPVSDYLLQKLRPVFSEIIPDDKYFERTFNQFEFLLTLFYVDHMTRKSKDTNLDWAPAGRYVWADRSVLSSFDDQFAKLGANHPFLQHGLFDGNTGRFDFVKSKTQSIIAKYPSF